MQEVEHLAATTEPGRAITKSKNSTDKVNVKMLYVSFTNTWNKKYTKGKRVFR